MSNSTPEQQIALLNSEKLENTAQIANLNGSIEQNEILIDNYTSAIGEFQAQITSKQAQITELEDSNAILDEIIVILTPPQR